jgi:hypothetical protein
LNYKKEEEMTVLCVEEAAPFPFEFALATVGDKRQVVGK